MSDAQQFVVELPVFEGPLDLLLTLIERRELPVTELSVSKVTGDYLTTITALEQVQPEELRWFIDVGGRLLSHKTRALSQYNNEDEADAFEELTDQVRRYAFWRKLTQQLRANFGSPLQRNLPGRTARSRTNIPPNLTLDQLTRARVRAQSARSPRPQARHSVKITRAQLRNTMRQLLHSSSRKQIIHHQIGQGSRRERAVNLIAILELIKEDLLDIIYEPGGIYVKARG